MHIPARHVGTTKLLLIALDGFGGEIQAQYNPHEIQVDKTVPWQAEDSKATSSPLEPIGMGPRTIVLELFLDCFERGANASLAGHLAILTQMTLAIDPDSRYEDLRRPPLLALVNGPVPQFRCVLESLAIKVTMFSRNNNPVRATCSIKLREVAVGCDGVLWTGRPTEKQEKKNRLARDKRDRLRYSPP